MKINNPIKTDRGFLVLLVEDCGAEHPYSFEFLEEAEEFVRLHQWGSSLPTSSFRGDEDGNR